MIDYPKISVVTITYGHENFIEQTLDGVFMQDYKGEIEFIISNDHSPDATDRVIKDYLAVKEIPINFTIKYTQHEVNKGMMPNFIWALEQTSGKYIALCEGDDYWTDPLKLQKQVEFLEENEEYVIHSGKAQILKDNKLGKTIGDPLSKKTYDIADFYTKNNLVTCTAMFRNISISLSNFEGLVFGDWKLYTLLLSQKSGNLAYVADVIYSVYRIHEGGVMQKITRQHENAEAHIKQIESVNKDVNSKFTKQDTQIINSYCISIFDHQLQKSRYKECIAVLFRNIFLVKYKFPLRNYLGLIKYYKFSI